MKENGMLLDGVRVIEYANFVAAPSCGRILADWGAEVIKIEPAFGDTMRHVGIQWGSPIDADENPMFECENAGKKAIILDTRSKEGVEVIFKLLEDADVFVTNTRQKALDKSGLNYEAIKARCPHIIYAHLLGYGEKGPAKDNPAFDYTAYFARGGVAMGLMEKDTAPCNTAAGLGDHYAGLGLAGGIAAALYRRTKTGKGERVTVSLFHTAVFGMGLMVVNAQYGYQMPITRRQPPNPLNTTYKCADGKWIQIAFFQYDKWFPGFCDIVIERPDLKGSKYSTLKSVVNYVEEFVLMMEDEFIKRDSEEWCKRLQEAGIPYEMLATPTNVLHDEQCWANDYIYEITYPSGNKGAQYATPVRFTEAGHAGHRPSPTLGQDTDAVMKEAGYSDEEIAALKEAKVIG